VHEVTSAQLTLTQAPARRVEPAAPRRVRGGERIVVEEDPVTGVRLKYYSQTADVSYWTELWRQAGNRPYTRESRGHLPHQLRQTFSRWARRGGRTLEAGCGLGHFTVAAKALGYAAEGLDWSAETIDRLRHRFPSITWHVGDVRGLDFRSGTFDTVYSPGVCEHFAEGPVRVLMETRRILRLGGIAVISTPCFNTWLQRHADLLTARDGVAGDEFFQYAFTPKGMANVLERLGFEILQVRPYAVLDTFIQHRGWRIPSRLTNALALTLDYLPVVRDWGSTCIWVARKC
jgi:SAM-dependent methyltransferase